MFITAISTTAIGMAAADHCKDSFAQEVGHYNQSHEKCLSWVHSDKDHHCHCDEANACFDVIDKVFPIWTKQKLSCDEDTGSHEENHMEHTTMKTQNTKHSGNDNHEQTSGTFDHYQSFIKTCGIKPTMKQLKINKQRIKKMMSKMRKNKNK